MTPFLAVKRGECGGWIVEKGGLFVAALLEKKLLENYSRLFYGWHEVLKKEPIFNEKELTEYKSLLGILSDAGQKFLVARDFENKHGEKFLLEKKEEFKEEIFAIDQKISEIKSLAKKNAQVH
jgi:hypothetical protein